MVLSHQTWTGLQFALCRAGGRAARAAAQVQGIRKMVFCKQKDYDGKQCEGTGVGKEIDCAFGFR